MQRKERTLEREERGGLSILFLSLPACPSDQLITIIASSHPRSMVGSQSRKAIIVQCPLPVHGSGNLSRVLMQIIVDARPKAPDLQRIPTLLRAGIGSMVSEHMQHTHSLAFFIPLWGLGNPQISSTLFWTGKLSTIARHEQATCLTSSDCPPQTLKKSRGFPVPTSRTCLA